MGSDQGFAIDAARAAHVPALVLRAALPDAGYLVSSRNVAAIVDLLRAEHPATVDGRKRAVKLLLRAQGVDLSAGHGQARLSREWVRIRDERAPNDRADAMVGESDPSVQPASAILRHEWLPILPRFLLPVLPMRVRQLRLASAHESVAMDLGEAVVALTDQPVNEFEPEFVAAVRSAAATYLAKIASQPLRPLSTHTADSVPLAAVALEEWGLETLRVGTVATAKTAEDLVALGPEQLLAADRSGWLVLELGLVVEYARLRWLFASLAPAVAPAPGVLPKPKTDPHHLILAARPSVFEIPLIPAAVTAESGEQIWSAIGSSARAALATLGFSSSNMAGLSIHFLEERLGQEEAQIVNAALKHAIRAMGSLPIHCWWDRRSTDGLHLEIDAVPLSTRAYRLLRRHGHTTFAEVAAEHNLTRFRGVGASTVVEILAWIEAIANLWPEKSRLERFRVEEAVRSSLTAKFEEAPSARRLGTLPTATNQFVDPVIRKAWRHYRKVLGHIRANDVRFRRTRPSYLLGRGIREHDGLTPLLEDSLRTLQARGLTLGSTPSKEVRSALRMVLSDREFDVIVNRWGLVDGRARTLEKVGSLTGVTRERVRQIEKKGKTAAKRYSAYLPRSRAALRVLRSLGGIAEEDELLNQMRESGAGGSLADLHALNAIGGLNWGPTVNQSEGYWSVFPNARAILQSARDAIREAARGDKGTTFSLSDAYALQAPVARADIRLLRSVARRLSGLVDLGDDFFTRPPKKGAVARHLAKILQQSGPIGEGALLRAFQRDPRFRRIPRQVLVRELTHNRVFLSSSSKWSVDPAHPLVERRTAEDLAIDILQKRGPLLAPELIEALRAEGIGEASARVTVGQSSLIQKWPRNVYTQVGARPTAGEIAEALMRRVRRRRYIDVVHLRDGRIKITADYGAFESSGALSLSGRAQLEGDWEGQADEAYRHRVRSNKGFVWGFGPWLRREHISEGELFSLTFDPALRTVWLQREIPPTPTL